MDAAIASRHPRQSADELPSAMKEAVAFTSEHSSQAIARYGSEVLRKMIHIGRLIRLT